MADTPRGPDRGDRGDRGDRAPSGDSRRPAEAADTRRYPVPGGRHRVEESIRRSRFITTVARAASAAAAHAFIDEIRAEFDDATHNCWAFVAGPPGASAEVGMSDDGEPHGTAGRPMLEALLHSGVGEIVAVVTRYYGGVKLGKGGLQRAYSGGVTLALSAMPRAERVSRVPLVVRIDYSALEPVRRVAAALDAAITGETFGPAVRVEVSVPDGSVERFREAVAEITAGKGTVEAPG
jgi:uncharacterized YigZ family protein